MNTQNNIAVDQGERIASVYKHLDEVSSSCRAFDIVLAADALIYALDRGRGLECEKLDVTALREHVEEFRHAIVNA